MLIDEIGLAAKNIVVTSALRESRNARKTSEREETTRSHPSSVGSIGACTSGERDRTGWSASFSVGSTGVCKIAVAARGEADNEGAGEDEHDERRGTMNTEDAARCRATAA